ncbi:hypothetical protein ACHBIE_04640 [Streptococcus sp. A23]|uniref:hypothetical protein n=1 Tax=Streptococcus sp. A23 TaxID=3373127 RepID=UPI002AACCC09|nr:hypothetical protein [Streptococcus suis]
MDITKDGLKNSVPVQKLVTAKISLSNGKTIEVTNPVSEIIELFQYVENPKNRFLNIGGVMVNVSQIVHMQWIEKSPIAGNL